MFIVAELFPVLQGTGSPTTPGATNHPITPSPTGSITSAPTPVGIASWNKIGSGGVSCMCFYDEDFDAFLIHNLFYLSAQIRIMKYTVPFRGVRLPHQLSVPSFATNFLLHT